MCYIPLIIINLLIKVVQNNEIALLYEGRVAMREFFNRLFRNEEGQDSERSSGSQGTAAETDASDTPAQPRVSAQGERLVIPTRRGGRFRFGFRFGCGF